MKKAFFLLFGLIFLISTNQAHALIVQGKSEVNVETNTNAGEGGTVYTHIETNINGKTQTFDSSKSGKIDIHSTSDNGQTTATVSSAAIAGPSAQPITEKPQKKEVIQIFFDNIKTFFKKFFYFL